MNSEVYKGKVDTPDESLARILNAAVRIKKSEDQIRRGKIRDLCTRVAKCTGADGGTFGNLFKIVTNLLLKYQIKIKIKI